MDITKVFVGGDTHTGSRTGLTPPEFWAGSRKWVNRQKADWDWFAEQIKIHGPFDGAIWMGDLVDRGVKDNSETTIQINDLQDAVVRVIEEVDAPKNFMVYGTAVHVETRSGFEFERGIAKQLNAVIKGQLFLQVNGFTLDIRHAPASGSGVKATRGTPIAKERISNADWYLEGEQPLADIYLRGHCHWKYAAGEPNVWMGYNVPALQRPATKYGRKLSNVVHYGFGILTFIDEEWPTWKLIEKPKEMQEILKF